MNIAEFSERYIAKYLDEKDIPQILELCQGNPQYYEHCPPEVSIEAIIKDMNALPPNKTKNDKHYFGFFEGDKLIAVVDLIDKFPDERGILFEYAHSISKTERLMGILISLILHSCVRFMVTKL